MKIIRNEIRTGLFALVTLAVLVGVLLYLGAPGVLRQMRHYHVYFDNAGGIQLGAPVMLAGRRIGEVTHLFSPVPDADRPNPTLEVVIQVEVAEGARIFRNAKVQMLQYGLMGEEVIDFTGGDESAGLARSDEKFTGRREPGLTDAVPKILDALDPVIKSATRTMSALAKTSTRLTELTAEGSDLTLAIANFKEVTANLVELSGSDGSLCHAFTNLESLTGEGGPLEETLQNARQFTGNLATNPDINASLTNLRQASRGLNHTVKGLNTTIRDIRPGLDNTVHNAAQFTDTIKHQPWRLIWPTTKKYSEDERKPTGPPSVAEGQKRPLWSSEVPSPPPPLAPKADK
jgi:ABC-type transporter Mla subunit MlaD